MLGGEGFGAPYALLPGSNSHGAIMGLRLGGRQLLKSFHHKGTDGMVERIPSIYTVSPALTVAPGSHYSLRQFGVLSIRLVIEIVGGCNGMLP